MHLKQSYKQIDDVWLIKKEVIENKATSANAIKRKVKAWDDVCNEFNSSGEGIRTVKQLKILYDNMKRRARKELATENVSKTILSDIPEGQGEGRFTY
ncbi:hypothetical protein NQ317_003628 [Molorchus minor]|uniref:Regulatory protein zeste n=1 Tax=Molorchus minor TaxID=1323400 RepID=A0ABQ9ITD1_9CUCU|nr:hypothetical protein NQ317_003628 [Molorchus minor]